MQKSNCMRLTKSSLFSILYINILLCAGIILFSQTSCRVKDAGSKSEKEQIKKQKKLDKKERKEYKKAKKQHLKKQSKDTRKRMKKSKKSSLNQTPKRKKGFFDRVFKRKKKCGP